MGGKAHAQSDFQRTNQAKVTFVAMPHIKVVKGIPTALDRDSYFDVNKRNLIVFDDQMINASKDKWIVNLFTGGSHHRNLNVIYTVQNLFHQGKGSRSINMNSHYLVLFKNPRDKVQLAKQMYPGQTDFFLNQYEKAVKRPFGYLLIDLRTTAQDNWGELNVSVWKISVLKPIWDLEFSEHLL